MATAADKEERAEVNKTMIDPCPALTAIDFFSLGAEACACVPQKKKGA